MSSGTIVYAPGKWSLKEKLDARDYTERVMTYKGSARSKGRVRTALPGFDQDAYIPNMDADK